MSARGGRLGLKDGLRVASVGLRARPLRAALSALGIAIGTAAIVGVLGLSSSSQAGLLAEIDRLGTNLLTVERINVFYGQFQALFDVSIEVAQGETVAIIGANGSTKSRCPGSSRGAGFGAAPAAPSESRPSPWSRANNWTIGWH